MLFHTWVFVLFFLIVYPVYLLVKGTRLKLPWLLLASYVFYGWWNPLYLLLILWSTTVDYLAVVGMSGGRRRTPWLVLSVVNNLAVLGFFKYSRFAVDSVNALLNRLGAHGVVPPPNIEFLSRGLNDLLSWLGVAYRVPTLELLLPVGISFFVFQSMSYTIDFYRGQVEREPSFLRYATFVSLFPQLVAGPIERAKNLLPQLRQTPRISKDDVADGLSLFVVGLFKKLALADYLALYVDKVYGAPAHFEAPALVLATVAFGWQIYFDFSGYTDMARGIGRMLGIRLMLNFNNPYLATSLGDFWRRWHISLSTWFKDYVYIPLGGNRGGAVRTYVNMSLTMLVSGLWHGASWTFVIWGALHALGRVLTRRLERTPFYRERVPVVVKRLGVFTFVTFAWIFFRAHTFGDAVLIVTRIFAFGRTFVRAETFGDAVPMVMRVLSLVLADPRVPLVALCLVLSVWLYQFGYESSLRRLLRVAPLRVGLVVFMVVFVALFAPSPDQPFIYFQF